MPPRKTPPSIIAAKTLVHALVLTPLAILAWQFWDVYSTNSDALGADPVAAIEHRLGLWALRFLMLALAITPLRQLTGNAVFIRFRRLIGLYAFASPCLHFSPSLVLDLPGPLTTLFFVFSLLPSLPISFTLWLLMFPMADTP